ncbi:hypothetical protein J1N09_12775 [Aureitalea sp. L0-47]|uniref:hypothetical protein n=1 Tax=Aureitalea sp. L0-47 TaxID=2816962 RepID=UPI0022381AF7|nr:hypothetical protein [Aureitalea sp. L0-47]MCW5520716.1 hypothetical protein [Aureitalea sp. L0-47]
MRHTVSGILLLSLLFISFNLLAQDRQKREFGIVDVRDHNVTSYSQDPEAAGVVLFEKGRNYWRLIDNKYIRLIKEVHVRMKVFDASRFEHATVFIPYYRGKDADEVINKFKAITFNGEIKNFVGESAMFDTEESSNWSVRRFTFPNVKDGSILEYSYQIESPFFFNFGGWNFQGDLPKMYTEFTSEIPGNYVYNRSLIGTETLDINDVSLKKDCFFLPGHKINADCEVAVYAMEDVPAFKEESYMLSKKNYLSAVKYELAQYTDFYGIKHNYAQDWDDADKEMRTDKELGRQLKLNYYFKSELPESIQTMPDELKKTKAIYSFIQSHYNWNGKSPFFGNVNVKKAFEAKTGNVSEINLALINCMEVANIDTKLVVLSTRENGLPRQNYPVITDFNYAVALIKVNGQEYLLDATDKLIPFGMLPERALNIEGRVLDFKEGSYWYPLKPQEKNVHYVNAQIKLQEDGTFTGKASEINTGYLAVAHRNSIAKLATKEYLLEKLNNNPLVEISNHEIVDGEAIEKPLKENYEVRIETEQVGDNLYFNPFVLNNFFMENPFKLDKRQYPVEFAYNRTNTYILSVELGPNVEIVELPKNRAFQLAGNAGECTVIYNAGDGKINLRYSLKLNDHRFEPELYNDIKNFFGSISNVLSNEAILLKQI